MTLPARLLLVVVLASCCAIVPCRRGASADEPAPRGALTLDVVVEEVDLAGNTLTARAYRHVIPPSGSAGGAVYSGHLPPGAKPARFERLPVMPQAGLKDKGLRPRMRATLRVATVKGAALVVVGVEPVVEPERVGVEWLNAPAPQAAGR